MKNRLIILLLLVFSASTIFSQDLIPTIPKQPRGKSANDSFPQTSSIYLEMNTTHYYKSPMFGIILERGFIDEPSNVTVNARVGAWFYPSKKENNFAVIQVGAFKTINKRYDIGFYLMDFNGHAFPRPSYKIPWDSMQKNPGVRPDDPYGYNSPFSIFFTARPFGGVNRGSSDNPAEKFEITTKLSYFTNSDIVGTRFGVMISLRYRLYHKQELIAPSPYRTGEGWGSPTTGIGEIGPLDTSVIERPN